MDLRVTVPPVPYSDLAGPPGETSSAVAARVLKARALQAARNPAGLCNAALEGNAVRELPREAGATHLLEQAVEALSLSGRAHDRLLRVARTLADLDGRVEITAPHMAEALQFRGLGTSEDMTQNLQ
jgi:magnesium chelatase family protein